MSEIRLDRIANQYVIIAPERLRRPNSITASKPLENRQSNCPFCEGNEHLTPKEIFALRKNEPDMSGWKTRVVPNLYKAVQIEESESSKRDGMFESVPGLGAHEIVIDTPCHSCNIEDLDESDVQNWIKTIVARIEDLQKDKRLVYISVFKNVGQEAGASQQHPHTQIIALPVMPKDAIYFLSRNMLYYQRHGRGIVEDILHNEILFKKRLVTQTQNFVAFCPFASSYPFEVMIAPQRNIISLQRSGKKEIEELGILVKSIFTKLAKQLGSFDYNLAFMQAPLNQNFENESYISLLEQNFRFTLRIIPRIYNVGGFELSSGMAINCMEPEECARLLRGEEI
ncbi:galactose-1-phosphate uridylyltransferase [Sulfurimonas sp. C5]|uniref:galactose-1-phosphate uridylyltransferase n=1 Tax=Sulfurimonas sp. C5 TaxID=3036947 RepID=UPI002458B385|nr:galactose-1-phosphate uridylyltransferase [Sulfurimonas sp. C5]MDH4944911.1 galactose-1-phosphate uridylyltransferase [Sulfurimonas sp. C5]